MKKGQSDRKASVKVEVTVLSVDRMGRVITSGCDEFEFGLWFGKKNRWKNYVKKYFFRISKGRRR